MIILKNVCLIFILALLSGCNEYEIIMRPVLKIKMADKILKPSFDGMLEPEMPNLDLNNDTILGVDSNNNNIRDDIEIWINRTGENYNERMALRQHALALREIILVGEKIYNLHSKGPINMQVEKEADYAMFLGLEVQRAIELESDSRRGCIWAVFVRKEYQKDFEKKYILPLDILNTNTELRKKALNSFYKYNHTYKMTQEKADRFDYCNFKVENLQKLKAEFEQIIKEQK